MTVITDLWKIKSWSCKVVFWCLERQRSYCNVQLVIPLVAEGWANHSKAATIETMYVTEERSEVTNIKRLMVRIGLDPLNSKPSLQCFVFCIDFDISCRLSDSSCLIDISCLIDFSWLIDISYVWLTFLVFNWHF